MNDDEARALKVGDKILVVGVAATVTAISQAQNRPVVVFDLNGTTGCCTSGFIEKVEPILAPTWYGDLMEERG